MRRRPLGWWGWRGVQVLGLGVAAALAGLLLTPSHATTEVTYRLAWSAGDVEVHADGSWTVENDAGATITVTDGTLATWSATLLECPHGHGLLDRVSARFGTAAASAGHSSGGVDEAEARGPVVESLVAPGTTVLGAAGLTEPDYCEGHTAVAATGASGDGTTLSITGTWTAPGETGAVPFTIESNQAWGAVVDVDLDGDTTGVTIVRDRATLFDGVDPFAQTDVDAARTVLANLTEHTTFHPTP